MTRGDIFKYISAALSGLAASFWGIYGPVIICVFCAIILDVITGLIKAKATGTSINSDTGTRGFWRKMALICALAFGIFLDAFIPIMLGVISLELPFTLPINAAAPQALPAWIKRLLDGSKETINTGDKKPAE